MLPIYSQSPAGKFVQLADGSIYHKAKDYTVRIDTVDNKLLTSFKTRNAGIDFKLLNHEVSQDQEKLNIFGQTQKSSITLKAADIGFLQYQVVDPKPNKPARDGTQGLKEFIVLRDNKSPNSFEFELNLTGVTNYKKNKSEGWDFYNKTDGIVFSIPKGFMQDKNKATSNGVAIEIQKKDGKDILTITADKNWLDAPERAWPVAIDPSVTVATSGGITDAEAQFGGFQRKIVSINTNKLYAFQADGGTISYNKSSNKGGIWASGVDIDGGSDTYVNPTAVLSHTTIYAAWIDDTADALEVQSIDTANSDTLGTKCTRTTGLTGITNTYTVSIAVDGTGTIYAAIADTSTGSVAKVYSLTYSGCVFTDITTGSGLAGSITGGAKPIVDTNGAKLILIFKSSSANTQYNTYDGSSWGTATNVDTNSLTNYDMVSDGVNEWLLGLVSTTDTKLYKYNGSSWTLKTAPWTSQTNMGNVTVTWDANGILYATTLHDASEQAYYKYYYPQTDTWSSEVSYGFTAGDMSQISADYGSLSWDVTGGAYASKSFNETQDTTPQGTFFKSDGTSMYIVGSTNDTVYQYTLSTAWDVSTASYASKSFSVGSQDTSPQGIFFKSDGLSMYVLGVTNNTVYQYTLSTAWDVSTASYASKSISLDGQGLTNHQALFFKPDGLTMYVTHLTGHAVQQYTLSTAWDVSSAVYASKFVSVTSQDASPLGVFFNPDGTSMHIIGDFNDKVYQYTLSTPWDVSTASYASKSFSTVSEDGGPRDLFFKPDGSGMYVVGDNNDTIYQYDLSLISNYVDVVVRQGSNLEVGFFDPGTSANQTTMLSKIGTNADSAGTGSLFARLARIDDTDIGTSSDTGSSATLFGRIGTKTDTQQCSTAITPVGTGSVAGTTYVQAYLTSSQTTTPDGEYFTTDGLTMYVVGWNQNKIFQYSLSSAWDVSTASYTGKSFSDPYDSPRSVYFKSDGSKMYILGSSGVIHQYTIPTPWDISTTTNPVISFNPTGQDSAPWGLFFKSDGTAMYVTGTTNHTVYQYSISTGWDLSSTVSYTGNSLSVTSQDSIPAGMFIDSSGTRMYIIGNTNKTVFHYNMTTAWDLSTASYASDSFSVNSQDTAPWGIFFKPNLYKMYIGGATNHNVYEYNTPSYNIIDSATCSNETLFGVLRNAPRTAFLSQFGGDGSETYPGGTGTIVLTDGIHQYDGPVSVGDGSTATKLVPTNRPGILMLFIKGALTVTGNAMISSTGYGATGGCGGSGSTTNACGGSGGGYNGANGANGSNSSTTTLGSGGAGSNKSVAGAGGGGGAGAAGTGTELAGAGGGGGGAQGGNGGNDATPPADSATAVPGFQIYSIFLGRKIGNSANPLIFKSYGAGGGGGAGGNRGGRAGGGGGGGGGGVLWIRTHSLTNNGVISANGGAGGNGGTNTGTATAGANGFGGNGGEAANASSGGAAAGTNGGGGGGGGGGGILYIEADSITLNTGSPAGKISAEGGNGGNGGDTSGSGSAGAVGGAGANGFLFIEIVP